MSTWNSLYVIRFRTTRRQFSRICFIFIYITFDNFRDDLFIYRCTIILSSNISIVIVILVIIVIADIFFIISSIFVFFINVIIFIFNYIMRKFTCLASFTITFLKCVADSRLMLFSVIYLVTRPAIWVRKFTRRSTRTIS
jgi:hypothetical protein